MDSRENRESEIPIIWVSEDALMCNECYRIEKAFNLVDSWKPIYSNDPLFRGYTVFCPNWLDAYTKCNNKYEFKNEETTK